VKSCCERSLRPYVGAGSATIVVPDGTEAVGDTAAGRTSKEAMSEPSTGSPLGRYRDAVTELLEAGTPLPEIEQAIGRLHDLDENEQSALWLFAFFNRDGRKERARRPPRLAIVS
jgi:hypothetical protein